MKLDILSQFLLIAHHPSKKRFLVSEQHINHGIIGAALLEMNLAEQLKVENGKLRYIKGVRSDNAVIADIAGLIRDSKKNRKIRYWISKLSRKSHHYKWAILSDLEKRKIVHIEHHKFLGLISYKKSYLIESNTRNELIYQLNKKALHGRNLDNEDLLMLGLIEACQMHRVIASDRQELKKLKKALKVIIKDSPIAGAVDTTIKEVQAALLGAMVATTVITTASN
ncbi:GPP34 family phosphoprotein [Carboxylicivirga sp. M1479]|uniref:GOLPH3/VPS74 family protein n=1 Tax=Carboxylicivirga sp. M1479 TaxID=2594476 RepID=UPI001178C558|nr:GPP34 family phosphoprotein [Carboxylicivirga sp. M1479]TRX71544.1 GPP34 family phosphoprotein [Carboxylicivirga sp. M1479]